MIRSLSVLALLLASATASAHFPWLYLTEEAYPRLFFGESLESKDYHLPETVSAAEVWQTGIDAPPKRLSMEPLEEDGFTGLEGEDPVEPRGRLQTEIVYGTYHGSKLTYYAQHFPADHPQAWPDGKTNESPLQAVLTRSGDNLLATITWQGEPLTDIDAALTNESGGEGAKAPTDAVGVATFEASDLAEGLNGIMAMHVDKDDAGEIDGKPYTSATHILTATFHYDPDAAEKVSALPPLPEAVASFGGVASEGWLYVYGGHIGQAHDHSRENLSAHFRRTKLDGSTDWEELPMGQPLQGLPLVAHDGKVYRVGGLDAHNASGEEEALHSVDTFASYDPTTREWKELPSLPNARSSHNAVVVGDTLYVVGGWRLHGDNRGEWQAGALAYDLASDGATWQELVEPPFKRRALAVSHLDGRVVVLCGMTDEADLSKQVFFYVPATKSWSEGLEFPGQAFHGFGLSAWNLDGKLYAGGMAGVLYQLSEDQSEWIRAAKFTTKRFFHQLVPDGAGALLAVAGASPEDGHTGSIERLQLSVNEGQAEEVASEPDQPPTEAAATAEPTGPSETEPLSEPTTFSKPLACPSDRWPQFRGVGTSVSAASEVPIEWSDEKGIAWQAALPGYGQSSPVIWDDRVFVTTMQGEEKQTPTVLCFDLVTGEELWRKEFQSSQTGAVSNYVSRAAPTPCVDERAVYASFESGDLYALSHAGESLWQRSLVDEYGKIEGNHGVGGSPVLAGSNLLVPMLHDGPSYLLAAAVKTGENRWKVDFEPRVAWSSPSVQGKTIVLSAAGTVEAYHAETGQQLWKLDGFEGNSVPSPSVVGDVLLIGAKERASNLALRANGTSQAEIVWRGNAATSSFASPLCYRGRAYFVSKAGVAYCLNAPTGELLWKERLPDSCWASPLGVGEHIYFFGKEGETVVYATDDKPVKVATNQLTIEGGSRLYGVAVVDQRLVIRTGSRLVCLSN